MEKDSETTGTIIKTQAVKAQEMLKVCEIWFKVPGVKASTVPAAQISVQPQEGSGVLAVGV